MSEVMNVGVMNVGQSLLFTIIEQKCQFDKQTSHTLDQIVLSLFNNWVLFLDAIAFPSTYPWVGQ